MEKLLCSRLLTISVHQWRGVAEVGLTASPAASASTKQLGFVYLDSLLSHVHHLCLCKPMCLSLQISYVCTQFSAPKSWPTSKPKTCKDNGNPDLSYQPYRGGFPIFSLRAGSVGNG